MGFLKVEATMWDFNNGGDQVGFIKGAGGNVGFLRTETTPVLVEFLRVGTTL